MMLDLVRRAMVLDLMRGRAMVINDRTSVLVVHRAVVIIKMGFPAIDVPHVDLVDVPGGGVVEEVVPSPFATLKAGSGVAVAVANSAIVADVRSPVAGVKAVVAALRAPIGRGPEHAGRRRANPGACCPEVAAWTVCPVAGSP